MGYIDFEVVIVNIDESVICVFVVEDFVVKLVYVKVEVILLKFEGIELLCKVDVLVLLIIVD